MVERRALEPDEIQEALGDLAGWTVVDDKLHRRFAFADFVEAFAFMTGVALIAEKLDHHPEWSNVYGTVTVDLVTHDLSAISTWDTHLAQKMNELAGEPT